MIAYGEIEVMYMSYPSWVASVKLFIKIVLHSGICQQLINNYWLMLNLLC